jgi:deoxyribodipyrimidine photo-lyase
VEFIRDSLVDLDGQLRALALAHGVDGVGLLVRHGDARTAVPCAGPPAGRAGGLCQP